MKLLALSDLHVEHASTREALMALPPRPDDWLILAGDVSDSVARLEWALDTLGPKFAKLFWVPGNHELWTVPRSGEVWRGDERYRRLVEVCRERAVSTPEDPYLEWPEELHGMKVKIAPIFLLYDYTFAPDAVIGHERAVAWAAESGIAAMDEVLLHFDPFPTRQAWCEARVDYTLPRLEEAATTHALVLVNHWPLRRDLVHLGRVPRYSPWCGTRASENWHVRFRAMVCVHGHLHVRNTEMRDGVRFEEVSLGYPRDWSASNGVAHYLRTIL